MSRLLFCIVICLTSSVYAGSAALPFDQQSSGSDAIGSDQSDSGTGGSGQSPDDCETAGFSHGKPLSLTAFKKPPFQQPTATRHTLVSVNIQAIRAPPSLATRLA